MKTLTTLAVTITMVLLLGTTTASANTIKGQKLFIKKYKESCGFTGAVMAGKHTQDEWEALNDDNKIAEEMIKICPSIKNVKEKFIPHLYDFFYKYASDSGNVPSC